MTNIVFIDLNNDSSGKMSTCKFRSKNQIAGDVPSCCGKTKKIYNFKCEKRDIFPLSGEICRLCNEFEKN